MAISSIGVGSGLPLDQLLEDLRKAESQPLQLIQQRQQLSEARLSGYGIIKNALTNLQKSAQALGDADKFGTLKATSSNQDIIGIKADNSAIAGNYNVKITSLATQQTLVAEGQASRDTNIGAGGTISFTINGKEQAVELGDDTSLEGIMKAINANTELGVQATMVNDGSDEPHRLMFTSKDTGTDAAVTAISVSGNDDLAAILNYGSGDSTVEQVSAAKNADISVNGIPITSQNNTIEGAIEGVTLDLKAMPTESNTEFKLSVSRDDSVAINAVKDFVKEYNSLLDTIKKQTTFDVEAGTSSVLTGDSLIRRVENQLRSAMNGAEGIGEIHSLADLGVTTDYKTGKLQIDDDTLSAAVKDNLNDVASFLSGENGISKRIDSTTNEFIKSGGLISTSEDSINSTIRMLKTQFESASDRIDQKMDSYRKQFTQLDVMVNQMNGMSTYLTQQLDMLANMNNPKK